MSGLRGVQFFGNYIESYTPLTPSFPRKRESIRFGNGKAAPRFHEDMYWQGRSGFPLSRE